MPQHGRRWVCQAQSRLLALNASRNIPRRPMSEIGSSKYCLLMAVFKFLCEHRHGRCKKHAAIRPLTSSAKGCAGNLGFLVPSERRMNWPTSHRPPVDCDPQILSLHCGLDHLVKGWGRVPQINPSLRFGKPDSIKFTDKSWIPIDSEWREVGW